MERGTAPVTLNDIVQAVAGSLKAVWPSRKVYADEIPQNADGAFYVAMEDVEQTRGLDRQQRRTVGVQVLYFLRSKDTLEYQKDSSDGKIPLSHLFLELRNGVEPADR